MTASHRIELIAGTTTVVSDPQAIRRGLRPQSARTALLAAGGLAVVNSHRVYVVDSLYAVVQAVTIKN